MSSPNATKTRKTTTKTKASPKAKAAPKATQPKPKVEKLNPPTKEQIEEALHAITDLQDNDDAIGDCFEVGFRAGIHAALCWVRHANNDILARAEGETFHSYWGEEDEDEEEEA